MALSSSRPDPTSPAAVADATFSTARRGYDQGEVREVLRAVAAEIGRLQDRERFLERELRNAESAAAEGITELDEDTVTRLLGEETLRVLQTARESASQIKIKAEEGAARILREAAEDAQRVREEAEVEAARKRHDAAADAEAEIGLAKQQGREMVNEARAYRERVLSELARRREVARQQIEQLIHGRDRLLQVFERARLVAVDVVSDLAPLGEPEEYVDLSPTTGPVPMMVPPHDLSAGDVATRPTEQTGPEDAAAEPTASDEMTAAEEAQAGEATDASAEPSAPDVVTRPIEQTGPGEGDGNVVSLFPGREDDGAKPDVDGLFARLRADAVPDAGSEPAAAIEPEAAIEPGDATEPEAADVADAGDEPVVDETAVVETVGDDTIFARRDADLVPLIVAAARKLKRVLADEQNAALETLRRKQPVTTVDALLPDEADRDDRYAEAIAAELAAAARAGAGLVDGGDPDAAGSAPVLDRARVAVRAELVSPLRDRLERAVSDGSGDNDDIAKRVRAVYREWKTQHIDDQLDDIVRIAHGSGVLAAVTPGTPMCWMVDPAGPACPDAEDNSLAGAVEAGKPFPTGHVVAPAHAGCRCLLALVPR